jgi:hypothetical protein
MCDCFAGTASATGMLVRRAGAPNFPEVARRTKVISQF